MYYLVVYTDYLPVIIFHNGCMSCHILKSTKGIEIKLGAYIDVNERKCRRQEPYSNILRKLSLLNYFHKLWFSLSCLGVKIVLDYNFCLL